MIKVEDKSYPDEKEENSGDKNKNIKEAKRRSS